MCDGVRYSSIILFTDDKPFNHKINRKYDDLPLIFKLLIFVLNPFYLFFLQLKVVRNYVQKKLLPDLMNFLLKINLNQNIIF